MNQILDEIESKENSQKTFSKLSFRVSIITLAIVAYILSYFPTAVTPGYNIPVPANLLIIAISVTCLSGVILTVLSFLKKEPSHWQKWVGGILNILLFIMIAVMVMFVG